MEGKHCGKGCSAFPAHDKHYALVMGAVKIEHADNAVSNGIKEYAWKLQKAYDNLMADVYSDSIQENLLSEYFRLKGELKGRIRSVGHGCGGLC